MAKPTTVLVLSDPQPGQTRGDWLVKVGTGRGGKNISRHRRKDEAVKRGRREGRKRKKGAGAVLKVQNQRGHLHTEATYGGAKKKGGWLFGRFL